jgi:hypothetical protein
MLKQKKGHYNKLKKLPKEECSNKNKNKKELLFKLRLTKRKEYSNKDKLNLKNRQKKRLD